MLNFLKAFYYNFRLLKTFLKLNKIENKNVTLKKSQKELKQTEISEAPAFAKVYNLDSFPISTKVTTCFEYFLTSKKGSIILIRGRGKKSYVQSVLAKLRIKTFYYSNFHLQELTNIVTIGSTLIKIPEDIIIVPEADILLENVSDYKIMKNYFTELKEKGKKIIILMDDEYYNLTNYFDFYIKLHWTDSDLEKMIKIHLQKIFTNNEIKRILSIVMSTSLSFNSLVLCIQFMLKPENLRNKKRAFELFPTIVNQIKSLEQKTMPHNPNVLNKQFNKELFNISVFDSTVTFDDLCNYIKKNKSFNLILHGPAGTGKTSFAEALLKESNKEILSIKSYDILGPYNGETESNLKDIFNKANETGAVIVIDEGDSLFADRNSSNVNRILDNSRTNTMLSLIDSYNVSTIITTNFLDHIDLAIKRRNLCVQFDYIKLPHQILSLCKAYFPEITFSNEQVQEMCREGSFTPSDFNHVFTYRQIQSKKYSSEDVFKELMALQKTKSTTNNKPIGFGA